jgi:hypothetical protein
MYLRGDQEVPNPDPVSGLYIRDRRGQVVKALIPPDHLAFQVVHVMAETQERGSYESACLYIQS